MSQFKPQSWIAVLSVLIGCSLHSIRFECTQGNLWAQAVAKRLGAVTDGTRAPHEPDAEVWVHTVDSH